jgi:hypothetical protein
MTLTHSVATSHPPSLYILSTDRIENTVSNISSIVECVSVAAEKFLSSRYHTTVIYSGSIIPAFRYHVTILFNWISCLKIINWIDVVIFQRSGFYYNYQIKVDEMVGTCNTCVEMKKKCKILVRKLEGSRQIERFEPTQKYNTKMTLK